MKDVFLSVTNKDNQEVAINATSLVEVLYDEKLLKRCNNKLWSIFLEVYFHIKGSDKYENNILLTQHLERNKLFELLVQSQYIDKEYV